MTKDYMEVLADAKAAEDEAAERMIAARNAMNAVTDRTPTAENYTTAWWDELAAVSTVYHAARDEYNVAHKVYLAAEKVWLKKVRG